MASQGGSKGTRRRTTKRSRSQFKKKQEIKVSSSSSSLATVKNDHLLEPAIDYDLEGCCTPKAERFKIPEIKTCPPAPKKQRVVSNSNCSMQRSPIAFFASPEIELFFFYSSSSPSCTSR